jgi:hypothetical protein
VNPLFDTPVKGAGVLVEGGSCPEPRVPTKIGTAVVLTPEQIAQAERIKNNQHPKVAAEIGGDNPCSQQRSANAQFPKIIPSEALV